jgi:recombinational DNA repair protein RecT
VDADVVHENDEFDWARGTEPFIRHKPKLQARGAPIGAYAIAWPDNGGPARFSVLSLEDLHAARAVSQSFQSGKGPWFDFEGEMMKKTAIRRGQKLWNLLPDSPLALAATMDDDAIDVTSQPAPRKAPPSLRAALSIETPPADDSAAQPPAVVIVSEDVHGEG